MAKYKPPKHPRRSMIDSKSLEYPRANTGFASLAPKNAPPWSPTVSLGLFGSSPAPHHAGRTEFPREDPQSNLPGFFPGPLDVHINIKNTTHFSSRSINREKSGALYHGTSNQVMHNETLGPLSWSSVEPRPLQSCRQSHLCVRGMFFPPRSSGGTSNRTSHGLVDVGPARHSRQGECRQA